MFKEKINEMIMTSRKAGEKGKVLVYQAVKNEFLKFKTAKNAGILDENAEIKLIQKMLKERQESAVIYAQNGRKDLAEKESFEVCVLKEMLPAEPNDEDYVAAIDEFVVGLGDKKFDKSQMGACIKFIKNNVLGADGKKCSQFVMARLNS